MKKLRGYIFSRPFMGERVPQHVQNLVIRDYCSRHQFDYLLSAAEYAMEECRLILEQLLGEMSEIDGIVAYSLFQLPEDNDARRSVFQRILAQKKSLHFAVEGLSVGTREECERIENLWLIRKTLPHCADLHSLETY